MIRFLERPSLTEGHVPTVLLRLALPMVPVALSIVVFNLTDTYFVGRLGALPLAALAFTFPVLLLTGSISMGVGIGTSVTVSRALGAGDRPRAARLTTDAHLLAGLAALVLSAAGLLTMDPLFALLGAEPEVLPLVRRYMTVWYLGLPLVVVSMASLQVIQAGGDTRTPGLLIVLSVAANVLLDPLLIFGWGPVPALGIRGAAIATVLARSSSMFLSLWIIARRERLFSLAGMSPRATLGSWGRILHVGVAAAVANIMRPLSMGIITKLVAAHGVLPVAGYGVATRVETFALILIMAVSMVLTPYSGQNAGARKFDRVRQGLRWAWAFSLSWGVVALVVFLAFAGPVAGIFNETDEVVGVAGLYLRIMAVSYGFQGVVVLTTAVFNGLHMPGMAIGVAAVRLFALYVPLAWLGSTVWGLPGLFVGTATANVVGGVLSYVAFERTIAGRIEPSGREGS
jgi:putative MATE family efflux protein